MYYYAIQALSQDWLKGGGRQVERPLPCPPLPSAPSPPLPLEVGSLKSVAVVI